MAQELKAFGIRGEEDGRLYFAEVYTKRDVDTLLAEKDKEIAELKCQVNGLQNRSNLWHYNAVEEHKKFVQADKTIAELKAKLENVNELVKAANKFVDDLKNSDCSKKDDEIKRLKKSVQFFSDLHHNESESAKECFRRLMDLGLIDGWGLTEKFFVMPKYTKERLAQFEKQDAEIRRLQRALYNACANWARSERYTEATWHGDEHREELWANVQAKCRAKAKQYK